jgi:glycosyltransferase involved in cell wall biosynthesis
MVKKIIRNAWYARRWRSVFASYQRCVANSEFTAGWIKTRWGLDAEVVYPPVRAQFDEKPKCRTILSVGRFARNGTQKRQAEMVRAFTGAYDTLLQGWEFVCLGGVADNPADQFCFQEASDAARGYPVQVHANVSDSVVRDAYERAAVFWHAAGYGEDERLHPERFEHFGMSTVEAMAAGCVPVVIRKGGQPEIVQHGASGFLWDTIDELVGYTHRLATVPELRDEMARAARSRARAFTDPDEFTARMLRVLDPTS